MLFSTSFFEGVLVDITHAERRGQGLSGFLIAGFFVGNIGCVA